MGVVGGIDRSQLINSMTPCPLQDEFLFKVESTGVLTAESIVRNAIEIIAEKINTLSVAVREIQSSDA